MAAVTEAMTDREAIDAQRDQLVRAAEDLACKMGGQADHEGAGKSQVSKAMEVASRSPSLNVFLNWLYYQAARKSSADFWGASLQGQGGGQPGPTVASEVERTLVGVRDRLKQQVGPARAEALTMRCAAIFFGYLRRAIVAQELLVARRRQGGSR